VQILCVHYGDYYHRQYHESIFTGPQNAKFKGSKYVSNEKPQYERARKNLWVYSTTASHSLDSFY